MGWPWPGDLSDLTGMNGTSGTSGTSGMNGMNGMNGTSGMTNPDQALILQFAAQAPTQPWPMQSSPLLAALQAQLTAVDLARGRVTLHFSPGDTFIQGGGVVQGGAVMTMLDYAMAFAAFTQVAPEQSVVTANLTVSFLRAVRPGELVAEGEVERAGRSLVFTRARLLDAQGLLLATAVSTLPVVGR